MTLAILLTAACSVEPDDRKAEKGFLDLSDYDLERPVALNGEWEFYWRELIDPSEFPLDITEENRFYHEFPQTWNSRKINNESTGSYGYATFRLRIKLPDHIENPVTGERLLLELFPDFGFTAYKKLEYLTFFYGAVFLIHFLRQLYRDLVPRPVLYALHSIIAAFSLFVLVTPVGFFSHTIKPYQIVYLIQAAFVGYILVKATVTGRRYGLFLLSGSLIMIGTSINDILYANRMIQTGYIVHYGMFAFILAQSTVVSFNFASAFKASENLAEKLKATNLSYARFVPEPLLKLLHREDITDVRLGDQIQKEMTLLFCDIRGFTPLSESMTAEDLSCSKTIQPGGHPCSNENCSPACSSSLLIKGPANSAPGV